MVRSPPPSTSTTSTRLSSFGCELRIRATRCPSRCGSTTLTWSSNYPATGDRTERLVSLSRAAGATTYLSGPSAREYLEQGLFDEAGIEVEWADYSGYAEYPQLHPPFEHGVTILDLLFNVGAEAPRFLKSAPVR